MKKILLILSISFIALFLWFYKKNDPVRVSDTIEYEYKKKIADSKTNNIIAATKLDANKRLPSSTKKLPVPYTDRTFKFKDYSRLPAKFDSSTKAPERKKQSQNRHQHMDLIRNQYFGQKQEIETPMGSFLISDKLQAINKTKYDSSMGSVYKELNQHILFSHEQGPPPNLNQFNPGGPLYVTYNKNSGKMGILTGKIILEFKDNDSMNKLDEIVEQNQLQVLYEAREIKTFYLSPMSTTDLNKTLTILRNINEIKRADLEIIENLNRPL